jgi:hypothetical protein
MSVVAVAAPTAVTAASAVMAVTEHHNGWLSLGPLLFILAHAASADKLTAVIQ